MKKVFPYLMVLFLLVETIVAQTIPTITPGAFELCGSDDSHRELMGNDLQYRERQETFEKLVAEGGGVSSLRASTIYKVPVVVHIMHLGEPVGTGTNITDEEIKDGIYRLNQRFRKIPGGLGDGDGVDVEVEFALAVRDPNGNCTNGIVRKDMSGTSSYFNYGVKHSGSNGLSDGNLKAASRWDPTNYYNIYVVSKIDGSNCTDNNGSYTAGYAYFASSHGSSVDGMIMLACSYVKEQSVTLTHELGHAFNLYHTFEGDNNGNNCPSANGNGDFCDDTPRHIRYFDHPQFSNQYNNCSYAGSNNCDAGTTQDHMHNYMDYAYDVCINEFTADQKARIITATTGLRKSFLESNGNLSLVPPLKASIDFDATTNVACTGSTITFNDASTCSPNTFINSGWPNSSFLWTFDNGVNTPITSTDQNPSITFNTPGLYSVTLQLTNSIGTSTSTKNDFIAITGNATSACIPPTGANEGNFGFVITNVKFNTIDNSTSTSTNVTYTDYSCSSSTFVRSGQTYSLSVGLRSGSGNQEKVEAFIDWNDNGVFENGEQVLSDGLSAGSSGTFTVNVAIPPTAVQNKLLRMRVYGEANTLSAAEKSCSSAMFVPDVEDYGVYVLAAETTPLADFSADVTTICVGNAIAFSDLSTNNPTSWTWTFNGGTPSSSTDQNQTVSYNTAGTYSVALSAGNSVGTDTESKVAYITVKALSGAAGAITGVNTACHNDVGISYSIAAVNDATSYSWTVPSGTSITSGQGTTSITVDAGISGGGNVTVVPSNSCGNGGDATLAVAISSCLGPPPVADFSAASTTICAGNSIAFSDLSTNSPDSWSWTFVGGTPSSSSEQNPTITYLAAGTYSVSLTSTNAAGSDMETKTSLIIVTDVPDAAGIISGGLTACTNDIGLAYSVSAVSGADSYNWTVPSGVTIASGQGTNAITVDAGISVGGNITVVPVNNCGNGEDASLAIVISTCVDPAPVANFSAASTDICAGGSITFSDLSSNAPDSWSWVFEGGTPSTSAQQNPTVTYAVAGTYSVSLTSTNSGGADTETKAALITVTGVPANPGGITGPSTACTNDVGLNYSIATVNGATSYAWTSPSGTTITSGQGTNAITLDAGVSAGGNIIVVPSNGCGNGTSANMGMVINSCIGNPPVADFSANSTTICVGGAVSFSDLSTNSPDSWSWTFSGGSPATSVSQNPTVTYNAVGVYQVELTSSNGDGSGAKTKNAFITVNGVPANPGTITGADTVCSNASGLTYSILAVDDATSYLWSLPAGVSINGGQGTNSIGIAIGNSSGGVISVVPSNTCGDAGNSSKTIVVKSCSTLLHPVSDFSVPSDTICMGDSIVFADLSSNTPITWNWTFGGGTPSSSSLQNPNIKFETAGTYTVHLTASNVAGSGNKMSKTIDVSDCSAITGIVPANSEIETVVYPNPTTGVINVDLSGNTTIRMIYLTDIMGNRVFESAAIKESILSIDLTMVSAGVYTLQIVNDAKTEMIKVVKN